MATYASIKYDMDLSSNATGTGALTLLSTQTASSSSTISFTSGIDSTYKEYVFKLYDIHPSGNDMKVGFQGNAAGVYVSYIAGYCNTTSAITAAQFKPNSGTFDGTIKLYGIA